MLNKKIQFTAPYQVDVICEEVDFNDIPQGHVLLKKLYSVVSAGTELACLSGGESWFKLPRVPGYTNVARIQAAGAGVEGFKEGDLVFQYGGHSLYQIMEQKSLLAKVPEKYELKNIPFIRLATVAFTSTRVSEIELGDFVAVSGQGLVGNIAAQLAALQGAQVIALDTNENRLSVSKKCGIEYTVNPSREDLAERIKVITGGQGVDTFIEATGLTQVALEALKCIRFKGELILLGTPRAKYEGDITEVLRYCHKSAMGSITFKGAQEWIYPANRDNFSKHSIERNTNIVMELINSGKLQIEPLRTQVIRPEEAPAAYAELVKGNDSYLGVVIDWNG